MRIQYVAIINSNKALSILFIKESRLPREGEGGGSCWMHEGPNRSGVRRSWMESDKSAQGYRGKATERRGKDVQAR